MVVGELETGFFVPFCVTFFFRFPFAVLFNSLHLQRKIVDLQYLDKEKIGLRDGDRSLIYDILWMTSLR